MNAVTAEKLSAKGLLSASENAHWREAVSVTYVLKPLVRDHTLLNIREHILEKSPECIDCGKTLNDLINPYKTENTGRGKTL